MADMPTDLLVELRDIFNERFDSEGLESLALMLGVDYENLPGRIRKIKAQNLSLYLWRHDSMGDLATIGPVERPDIEWADLLQRHGVIVRPADETAIQGAKVKPTDLQALVPIVAARPMFLTPDGRQGMLSLAGVDSLVTLDLSGSTTTVAGVLLDQLNRYGSTEEGDTALGRFLLYVAADTTVPPSDVITIERVINDYGLRAQPDTP